VHLDGLDEIYLKNATDDQLAYISQVVQLETEKLDARLNIMGSANTKGLTGVNPARVALRQQAMKPITRRFLERMGKREMHWCGTLFPNQASAQDAEMSLAEYEDFVFGACLVDRPDPMAEWQRVSGEQQRIVDLLNARREFRVVGPDTELRFRSEGRLWINCDGQLNFPDGEVFTGPVEDSMEGHVRFTYPAVYQGREVQDVRLRFAGGKVVEATALHGEEFLRSMIGMDEGASRVGEFAIGTNAGIQRFTKNTLFDEKIGGTFHMAVGASLPETGGVNVSGIHWDMVCDLRKGGEIYADGKLIYQGGRFVI